MYDLRCRNLRIDRVFRYYESSVYSMRSGVDLQYH